MISTEPGERIEPMETYIIAAQAPTLRAQNEG